MKKPSLLQMIGNFFKRIFGKKKPKKKRRPNPKGKGITVIPKDLLEIKIPLFENFDKIKFYKFLRRKFPKRYKTIYRMMALETRHFKSSQFTNTGSAGMEVHKREFPYGWTIGRKIWEDDNLRPFGYRIFTDAAKRRRAFLAFRTPASFATILNLYLNKYRAGRWRSTDPVKAAKYEKVLKTIRLPKV